MALELVGGSLFTLLYDGVKEAMIKTTQFKSLLADLKATLDSLQPRIIEQIGEHNTELGLQNNEIEDLQTQMEEGIKLVGKFSKFRVWNYCCVGDYADQLIELDRALRRLLDMLRLQEARDVKETLLLSRQNRDKLDEVNRRLIEIQKLLAQQQQQAGGMKEATDSGNNTEAVPEPIQGNGIQVAALDGGDTLVLVFGLLFDAVLEVEDKAGVMFKTPLGDFKSTLVSLKPLIEEISQHNKVLVRPKEELENLTKEMEKGVELIPKCSNVHPRASFNRSTYTEKLIGLENFLQRQLYILKRQVARDVRNTLVSIRNVEVVIEQIEKSGVLQNKAQLEGCLAVSETSLPTVGLDAVNVQGTTDVVETKNTEAGVKPIEGTSVEKNQLETNWSPVAEPSAPTAALDTVDVQGTKDVEVIMSSIKNREAGVKPIEEIDAVQNQLETSLLLDEKASTFRSKDDDQSEGDLLSFPPSNTNPSNTTHQISSSASTTMNPPPTTPKKKLQLQGPRPAPLELRKDSVKMKKPPPHPLSNSEKTPSKSTDSTTKVRLVRCPKCRLLLPELPDFQVYKCGGCGAILRVGQESQWPGVQTQDEIDVVKNE